MKLSVTVAALLANTYALESTEVNTSGEERSVWVDTPTKYLASSDKMCITQNECGDDFVCASYNWEYNKQLESSKQGCWHKSVCMNELGTQSFSMFDERKIQWYCGEEALAKINGDFGQLAYPIKPVASNWWEQFTESCRTHQDCRDRSGIENQSCTQYIWDATADGASYGSGYNCYTWDRNVCAQGFDTPSWSIINENYKNTKEYSHYIQFWCQGDRRETVEAPVAPIADIDNNVAPIAGPVDDTPATTDTPATIDTTATTDTPATIDTPATTDAPATTDTPATIDAPATIDTPATIDSQPDSTPDPAATGSDTQSKAAEDTMTEEQKQQQEAQKEKERKEQEAQKEKERKEQEAAALQAAQEKEAREREAAAKEVLSGEVNMMASFSDDPKFDEIRLRQDQLWDEKSGKWMQPYDSIDGSSRSNDQNTLNKALNPFFNNAFSLAASSAALAIVASMVLI